MTLEDETRHLRAGRTPFDILNMIDNYAYDSDDQRRAFAMGLIATYGRDCAALERERCIEVLRGLGWLNSATDEMAIAVTTAIATIRKEVN